jgi:L-lactate dehydrogenase complex protein LldG
MSTILSKSDAILSRLRSAGGNGSGANTAAVPDEAIFAPIADPYARFLQECAGNLTECKVTHNFTESKAVISDVLRSLPAGPAFVEDSPLLPKLPEATFEGRTLRWSSEGAAAENTQVTVTLAHAFVAQTGSILTSARCGGRGASIIPPTHVVYGTAPQIVPDLRRALELITTQGLTQASFVGLITGSSRTADIEKILVQGAHGPRRLVVVMENTAAR